MIVLLKGLNSNYMGIINCLKKLCEQVVIAELINVSIE